MIGGFLANAVDAAVAPFMQTETFESLNGVTASPARMTLVSGITVFLLLLALLFVGKFLWNRVLVELISFAKPVKSVWQLLGLAVLLSLLHPGNCCPSGSP
jgi:hypothetical protein